jgi:hypothetical protein
MLLGDLLNSGEPTYAEFIMFLGFFIFAIIGSFLGINFIINQLFNRNPEA